MRIIDSGNFKLGGLVQVGRVGSYKWLTHSLSAQFSSSEMLADERNKEMKNYEAYPIPLLRKSGYWASIEGSQLDQ